jgi:hypothetical protein
VEAGDPFGFKLLDGLGSPLPVEPCPPHIPELPCPEPLVQNDVLSMAAGDAVVDAVAQDVVAETALLLLAA